MIFYILIIIVLAVSYFSLLSKYKELWQAIPVVSDSNCTSMSVAVIIPFRNEESSLMALISSINALDQCGHQVEIIFVNDHSTDRSVELVNSSEVKFPVKMLNLGKETGKKSALQFAYRHTHSEVILQTDADCVLPTKWLETLLMPFGDKDVKLVSGPVTFFKPTNFWQRLVSLDFQALIAIGAAHIRWEMPMICNGANMAYRREVIENYVFNSNKASGDDISILQYVHSELNGGIFFCKQKNAMVRTNGPSSFGEFWNQRLRWASKNGDYAIKTNIYILIGLWVYNLFIVCSFLSFTSIGFTGGFLLLVMKILAEDKFYGSFSDFFKIEGWFKNIFLGQPFHILYMAFLPPLSQILKYQWKERKLK